MPPEPEFDYEITLTRITTQGCVSRQAKARGVA